MAEYRCKKADGGWADVCDRVRFVRDASGKVVRVVGAILDLTIRKRALEQVAMLNQQLHRRVSELETLFQTVPIGIAIAEDIEGPHHPGEPGFFHALGCAS